MRTTALNKIARQHIADICERNGWVACRLGFAGCWREAHAPAHRHERNWYKGKPPELLWAVAQWVPACTPCHQVLDHKMSKAEREALFVSMKGEHETDAPNPARVV
jgi:hypothetical protein